MLKSNRFYMQESLLFLGLQPTEIFLIVFALLLLFGAKKIPELARGLGRGIREFKDATKEVKKNIEEEISESPAKEK